MTQPIKRSEYKYHETSKLSKFVVNYFIKAINKKLSTTKPAPIVLSSVTEPNFIIVKLVDIEYSLIWWMFWIKFDIEELTRHLVEEYTKAGWTIPYYSEYSIYFKVA